MEIVLSHHHTIAAILAQLPTVAERARLAVVCRAWAVAVRRSPEIWRDLSPVRRGARMFRLCAEGNFAELKRSAALFDAPRCLASFEYACVEGRVDIAEWLVDRYDFGMADLTWTGDPLKLPLLTAVCGTKHLHAIQWFILRFKPTKDQLLHSECLGGPVDAVEEICGDGLEDFLPALDWVVQHYKLDAEDLEAWGRAASYRMCGLEEFSPIYDDNARVGLLRWLADRQLIPKGDNVSLLMTYASASGFTAVVQFLADAMNVTPEDFENDSAAPFRTACRHGQLETAQWLAARFNVRRHHVVRHRNDRWSAMTYACRNGHLHVAQWLTSHYGVTSEDLCADAHCEEMLRSLAAGAYNGYLPMLKWLMATFNLSSKRARLEMTARVHGKLELVEWLNED